MEELKEYYKGPSPLQFKNELCLLQSQRRTQGYSFSVLQCYSCYVELSEYFILRINGPKEGVKNLLGLFNVWFLEFLYVVVQFYRLQFFKFLMCIVSLKQRVVSSLILQCRATSMSCSFPVEKYMIVNITAVSQFISYTHDTDLLNFAHALSDCLLTERSEVPFHDVIVGLSVCTSVRSNKFFSVYIKFGMNFLKG